MAKKKTTTKKKTAKNRLTREETYQKNRGGRPKIGFDREECKKLLRIWATKSEVAGFFGISEASLERICYEWASDEDLEDGSFEALRKKFGANTKMSLRRSQIHQAIGNPEKGIRGNVTMAIWLGKQILGQRDNFEDISDSEALKLGYSLDDL